MDERKPAMIAIILRGTSQLEAIASSHPETKQLSLLHLILQLSTKEQISALAII